MRKIECDGCGKIEDVPKPSVNPTQKATILGFVVTIEREDGESSVGRWDLCEGCRKELLRKNMPPLWPRVSTGPNHCAEIYLPRQL